MNILHRLHSEVGQASFHLRNHRSWSANTIKNIFLNINVLLSKVWTVFMCESAWHPDLKSWRDTNILPHHRFLALPTAGLLADFSKGRRMPIRRALLKELKDKTPGVSVLPWSMLPYLGCNSRARHLSREANISTHCCSGYGVSLCNSFNMFNHALNFDYPS